MEKDTAKTYKALQELAGPIASFHLSTAIGLALSRTKAESAASIAAERPEGLASSHFRARQQLRPRAPQAAAGA